MGATEITIQELSGPSPITITLRGRALPYRGMPTPTKQRVVTTWYQGNPKATQQVMGVSTEPTEINGMWKAKFITVQDARVANRALGGVDAEVGGEIADEFFGASNGATILVAAFERLLARGNECRFQWGRVVRFGVLSGFEPNWIREEDVEWSMTWDWNGSEPTSPRTGTLANPGQDIQQAIIDTDSKAATIPFPLIEAPARTRAFFQLGVLRDASINFLGFTRQAATAVTLPARVVQGALGQAVQIRDDATVLTGQMMDVPYTYLGLSDSVSDVMTVENWRRDLGRQTENLVTKAQQEADQLASLGESPDYRIVTVGQGQTLRHVALLYYGNADDWTVIAEANRLPTSNVRVGTVVRVPTRLSGAAGELVR